MFTPPQTIYVALLDLTNTELTGGGYARVALANTTTNWPAPTGQTPASVSNGVAVTFAVASTNWNTAVWFALYDALTAGNLLFQGPLLTPIGIIAGQALNFSVGSIVVQAN